MNALKEFIEHIDTSEVLCSEIKYNDYNYMKSELVNSSHIILTTGYSKEDMDDFLSKLNFEYDDGYGSQKLFGTIWFKDGTWSTRGEYDGSEWWEHHKCPNIPLYIISIEKERHQKLNELI
jgi:hypothetical protein